MMQRNRRRNNRQMKIVIFAGGTGRRLWPISRRRSPKQFEPLISNKSTIQLAVERVGHSFGIENVLVSSNEKYRPILMEQLGDLPGKNFIGEPMRRDLAAAVGLAMVHVNHRFGPDEAVAIIWGDNYMTETGSFRAMLSSAESIIKSDRAKIIFIGETARFPNENLGWIQLGRPIGKSREMPIYEFRSWHYRPSGAECQRMFESNEYVWNTGYFITTAGYVLKSYKAFQSTMWEKLNALNNVVDGPDYQTTLMEIYPTFEEISFDDAIVKQLPKEDAVVLHGTMGWSDPGTLYALKEAINSDKSENVELGLVKSLEVKDCLLYNYEDDKLMAAVGLEGMIVVNTKDAILVVHKDNVRLVKKLVDGLIDTELESYS